MHTLIKHDFHLPAGPGSRPHVTATEFSRERHHRVTEKL
jgi:hypothetical protein